MGSLSLSGLRPRMTQTFEGFKSRIVYPSISRLAGMDSRGLMDRAGTVIQRCAPSYEIGLTRAKAKLRTTRFETPRHHEALTTLLDSKQASAHDVAFADLLIRHKANPALAPLLREVDAPARDVYDLVKAILKKWEGPGQIPDAVIETLAPEIADLIHRPYWSNPQISRAPQMDAWRRDYRQSDGARKLQWSIDVGQHRDKSSLTTIRPILNNIMAHIRSTPDQAIASMFFPQTILHRIEGMRAELKLIGITPEYLIEQFLSSCSFYSTLGFELVTQDIPGLDWVQGFFPVHASLMGFDGDEFIIYDSAMGKITGPMKFSEVYSKTEGEAYVANGFVEALKKGPAATQHFLLTHPLGDYYFFQPANEAGFAPAFTLNLSTVMQKLFQSTNDSSYLIFAQLELMQAAALHPNLSEIHSGLSLVNRQLYVQHKRSDRIQWAIEEANTAASLNPFDPMAHFQLGKAHYEWARQTGDRSKLKLAQEPFLVAQKLDPKLANPIANMFSFVEEDGDFVLSYRNSRSRLAPPMSRAILSETISRYSVRSQARELTASQAG